MVRIVALALLITLTAVQGRSIEEFVQGGETARPGDAPYVAFLTFEVEKANDRKCTGVLISPSAVLTTASCVQGVGIGNVILGAIDLGRLPSNPHADVRIVSSIDSHAAFNPTTLENDIAIVKLDKPARLQPGIIEVVAYDTSLERYEDDVALVAGFGSNGKLSVGPVNTISVVSCRIRYPTLLRSTQICAGNWNLSPCEGEEGAPLVVKDENEEPTVIGFFSYIRDNDCKAGWPAVYTRVSDFAVWIWLHV